MGIPAFGIIGRFGASGLGAGAGTGAGAAASSSSPLAAVGSAAAGLGEGGGGSDLVVVVSSGVAWMSDNLFSLVGFDAFEPDFTYVYK